MSMNQDQAKHILEKYGAKKYRLYSRLYESGIPEKYWRIKVQDFEVDRYFIAVVGKSNEVTKNIFALANSDVLNGNMVKVYDFLELINKLMNQYGNLTISDFLLEIDDLNSIYIKNISYGRIFDKYEEIFIQFLRLASSHRNKKRVILGFEESSNFNEAYGEMKDFLELSKAHWIENAI